MNFHFTPELRKLEPLTYEEYIKYLPILNEQQTGMRYNANGLCKICRNGVLLKDINEFRTDENRNNNFYTFAHLPFKNFEIRKLVINGELQLYTSMKDEAK